MRSAEPAAGEPRVAGEGSEREQFSGDTSGKQTVHLEIPTSARKSWPVTSFSSEKPFSKRIPDKIQISCGLLARANPESQILFSFTSEQSSKPNEIFDVRPDANESRIWSEISCFLY